MRNGTREFDPQSRLYSIQLVPRNGRILKAKKINMASHQLFQCKPVTVLNCFCKEREE